MTPRILLYVPLNPNAPRIHPRTVASLDALDWPAPIDIVYGRHDHAETDKEAAFNEITDKYSHARVLALRGGYDALLTVEADMVVPPLALHRLTAIHADIAYGLYCSRHNSYQWLAFTELNETGGRSISDTPDLAKKAWGTAMETKGVGFGCTLIWRNALAVITMRRVPSLRANDWYFCLDAQRYGYRQVTDFGTVCGHIENGRIIWPDPDSMYRLEDL